MDSNLKKFLIKKLQYQYGEEIEILEMPNNLEVKYAYKPARPIDPKDLDLIIIEAIKEFNLNKTVLARSVLDNGTILIGQSSN